MLCTKMQWIFSFLTVIVVVNTIESITQAGSPIFFNYPSGTPQIPHGFGESQGICVIPIPDQQRTENDVSNSGELQPNPSDAPTEIQIWTVIISLKESFELFLQYLRYKLNVFVRNHDVGSLLITVECSSLEILEGLWEDYRSGHLSAIAQEILVTAEVLEKLDLDDVRLKTFISEEEYKKGKQVFVDYSGECVVTVELRFNELLYITKSSVKINNSPYLARKYACIFVREHCLFLEANSFPRP